MKNKALLILIILIFNSSWAAKVIKDTKLLSNFHFITISGTIESPPNHPT